MPYVPPSKSEQPRLYAALTLSTLLHGTLMAVLALWRIGLPPEISAEIESRWTPENKTPAIEVSVIPRESTPETTAVASSAASLAAASSTPALPRHPAAVTRPAPPKEANSLLNALAQQVGAAPEGTGTQNGSEGDGAPGDGFFGLNVAGDRVVFVVDCSRSMNAPHFSDGKPRNAGDAMTRFNRVRLELVQSIGGMDAEQQFFVVFFNNTAVPMPATTLQLATRYNQQRYLSWVATATAHGQPTDPRDALGLALRLGPDTIYFLTDGDFDLAAVKRDLRKLRQTRTKIHTFAFSNSAGEDLLKFIAQNNGGEYKYIP